MRSHFEEIWRFETKRFAVTLSCEPEQCPDVSWADAEVIAKLNSGEYVNVTFKVAVLLDGREIASDYLGNSVYANVKEFRDHIGSRGRYGSYFTDMVRSAIADARSELCSYEAPKLRCA